MAEVSIKINAEGEIIIDMEVVPNCEAILEKFTALGTIVEDNEKPNYFVELERQEIYEDE